MRVDRVEFSREGGFTGIPLRFESELRSLPPEEATTLQKLVESADFFSLPAVIAAGEQGADRFQFSVTVDADGKRHSVKSTAPVPEALQGLIEFLTKLARRARGRRPV